MEISVRVPILAARSVLNDPTFPYRVAFGLGVFAVMGVVDWIRHPRNPTRVKEYAFLFGVTGAVMLYGLAHDAATYTISPDYFRILKGVRAEAFFPDVARVALMATWTVGLGIGLAVLVANNPSRRFAQLPYARLVCHLVPLVMSPLVAGALGAVAWLASGAFELPADVVTVWGIHVGSYVGAAVGLVVAVWRIRRERSRARPG